MRIDILKTNFHMLLVRVLCDICIGNEKALHESAAVLYALIKCHSPCSNVYIF